MNANKLKGVMAEKGISSARLAEKIGVSTQTMWRKLKDTDSFTLGEIVRICSVLGINDPKQRNDIFLA